MCFEQKHKAYANNIAYKSTNYIPTAAKWFWSHLREKNWRRGWTDSAFTWAVSSWWPKSKPKLFVYLNCRDPPFSLLSTHKKTAVVKNCYAKPIKQLIEVEPLFGYRMAASLLNIKKNIVQHVFQLKGLQVRKRLVGRRPLIQTELSKT